ncbi:MAG: arsenate reductase ArsC [bacterium]|nr:arsenate reductase ArsC [bacterium]
MQSEVSKRRKRKLKVLFLCVANSCRSQMAEGFARHFFADRIEPFSAGILTARVSPPAVQVMAEIGIDISGQTSKHYGKFLDENFDYVITLCDELEEHCPIFPGKATHIHLGFADPTFFPGTDEERLERHRQTRAEMKERLVPLLEGLLTGKAPEGAQQAGE